MGSEASLEVQLEPGEAGTVFVIENKRSSGESATEVLLGQGFSVTSCSTLEDCLECLDDDQVNCVIAEGLTPGMSGLELLRHMAVHNRWMPVIIFTDGDDVERAVNAIKMGATDVIKRPFDAKSVRNKVLAAMKKGEEYHESEIAAKTINTQINRLTPREREVMSLVVRGLSNKSIARQLGIAYRTVEVHRAHLREKMQVRSSAELIRAVLTVRQPPPSHRAWEIPRFRLHEEFS